MVDHHSTADVQRSFSRCADSPGFLDDFYNTFTQSEDLSSCGFVEEDPSTQKQLLRDGLVMMMEYAGGFGRFKPLQVSNDRALLERPCWLEDIWKPALFYAIKRHDDLITWKLLEEWDQVIQSAIQQLSRLSNQRDAPSIPIRHQATHVMVY